MPLCCKTAVQGTYSVGRSVGRRYSGGGHYVTAVAACARTLGSVSSRLTAAALCSRFGTPLRPVVAHRGSTWRSRAREKTLALTQVSPAD